MSGQPYLKFFPTDWRADPAVRMCSIGARGLWFEMLCLMHESHGFLKIGEKDISPDQLARLTGIQPDECEALLAELEDAGVFSRNALRSIYCRRMLRDIERAKLNDPTAADRMRRYRRRKKGDDPGPNGEGRYADRNVTVTECYTHGARPEDSLLLERESDSGSEISALEGGNSRTEDGAARRMAIADVEEAFAKKPAQRSRIVARLRDPNVVYPVEFAKKCIRTVSGKRAAKRPIEEKPPPPSVWVAMGTPAWKAWQRVDPQPALESKYFPDRGLMRPTEFPPQEARA